MKMSEMVAYRVTAISATTGEEKEIIVQIPSHIEFRRDTRRAKKYLKDQKKK